ncbi:helix-turn-helix domain-containing protein [Algisphaera agarilytica]|uniref:Helix-turn-helix domain-containing protein n=1 Tax=Algisphaera agarilytica TaxID=1385975 RepID=A0A7X0LLZ4_9BACT|nr:helix-turn-helix domain-containing protein [Algisphaera agarilytica]MBB6431131.1 hypothetical protein [Algisphaera agarilytica]
MSPKLDRLDRFIALTNGFTRHWLSELTGNELRVYIALAEHFAPGNSGLVWPSHKTLTKITGITRRQSMSEATRGLERAGLIAVIDWPMYTDIGAKQMRTLGGGGTSGRPNVYCLTHVDENGMHRAEQQRPGPADVMAALEGQRQTTGKAVRAYRQGLPASTTQRVMLDAYPVLAEFNPCWTAEVPDHKAAPFAWEDIVIAGVVAMSTTLERAFNVDDKPPVAEFGLQNPAGPSLEDEGRAGSGWIDDDAVAEAVSTRMQIIVGECDQLNATYTSEDRLGLDNLDAWRSSAPKIADISEQLEVGPREVAHAALRQLETAESDRQGCTLNVQGVHDKRTPPPTENVHPVHDKRAGGVRSSVHHRSRPIEANPTKENPTNTSDANASVGAGRGVGTTGENQ